MPEYINPHKHTVYLVGPDGRTTAIGGGERRILPEYFERYCGNGYLQHAQPAGIVEGVKTKKIIGAGAARPQIPAKIIQTRSSRIQNDKPHQKQIRHITQQKSPTVQPPVAIKSKISQAQRTPVPVISAAAHKRIVGRKTNGDATQLLHSNLRLHAYPVSNNIGVGILSYNRMASLQRLV